MSEGNRDKNDFEFIKEEVIQRRHRKARKFLLPFFMTIIMAVVFGGVAAATFCLTEPRIYKFLHRNDEVREPIVFPSVTPGSQGTDTGGDGNPNDVTIPEPTQTPTVTPPLNQQPDTNPDQQVIINKISAGIEDYKSMYEEIRAIAFSVKKSLVTVSGIRNEKDLFGSTVETRVDTSGLVIAKDMANLYILVSLDRVRDAGSLKIMFSEMTMVDAVLLDYENELNLAVLTASLKDIPSIYLNNISIAELGESYTLGVGTPVIAMGSPNGHTDSIDVGIVTSKDSYYYVTDNKLDLFNTNIRDVPEGDGIIVNLNGQIIGVITRTLKDDINENINTVIGISKLNAYIDRMVNKKPHIYCGIVAADMTDTAKFEHEVSNGIYVNAVRTNSPAFEAGIKGGDIIQMVDEKNILNTVLFFSTISSYQPGSEITVKIKRTSGTTAREMDLKVILTDRNK